MSGVVELFSGLFRIVVPIPNHPQKTVNTYLVCGSRSNTLIDVGEDHPASEEALRDAFSQIGIKWKDTRILFTHSHPDHAGCINRLYSQDMQLFGHFYNLMHSRENNVINELCYLPIMEATFDLADTKDPRAYQSSVQFVLPAINAPVVYLKDGDSYTEGSYCFEVIETTGHDGTHICLHDPSNKITIVGDTLLNDVVPIVPTYNLQYNALQDYFNGLEKIRKLNPDFLLPGHGEIFSDAPKQIDDAISFHQKRLKLVGGLVESGMTDIIEIASTVYDSKDSKFVNKAWETKYLSIGQILAYLVYLHYADEISIVLSGKKLSFISR